MLYYNRIDVSGGADVNKKKYSKCSKEHLICLYWYFLDIGFRFQSSVFNNCHDVLIMFIDIKNIVILNIHGVNYRCIILKNSKSEVINLLKNADLTGKSGSL